MLGVKTNAEPVLLDNGKEYCLEESMTEGSRDDCAQNLEDALWLSNRDKERIVHLVEISVATLKLQRNPCGLVRRVFSPRKCGIK